MQDFFKHHPDLVIMSLAIMFVAVLAVSFIWGVQILITNFNKTTFNPHENQANIRFDLDGAKALNLKGLVQ